MAENDPTPAGQTLFDQVWADVDKDLGVSHSEDITTSIGQTVENIGMSWDGLMAAFHEATGNYADADRRIEEAQKHADWLEANPTSVQDIREIWKDGWSGDKFTHWLASNIGQAGYIAAGGVPGAVGKMVVKGVASKAIRKQLNKKLKDLGIDEDSITAALNNPNLSENAAEVLARRMQTASQLWGKALNSERLAATVGSVAGYTAGFTALETGLIAKDVYDETGQIRPDLAAKYGIPAGLLAAPGGMVFSSMLRRAGLGGVPGEAAERNVRSVLKKAGIGAGVEAPTEMLQEAANIFASREARGATGPLTEEEHWQLINAGAAAFAAGGLISTTIESTGLVKDRIQDLGETAGRMGKGWDRGVAGAEQTVQSFLGESVELDIGLGDADFVVDTEGSAVSREDAATLDDFDARTRTKDATFGKPSNAPNQADEIAEKGGMGHLFNTLNDSRRTGSTPPIPEEGLINTGEEGRTARPETGGESFAMNAPWPEDKDGNVLVRDENGETHTLNKEEGAAYRQLYKLVPSFAKGILSTKNAIKFASGILQNRGGTKETLRVEIARKAQEIVGTYLVDKAGHVNIEEVFEGIIKGKYKTVDAWSEPGRNIQVTPEEAQEYREASQWLLDNPDTIIDYVVDPEGRATPLVNTSPTMGDTIPGSETQIENLDKVDLGANEEGDAFITAAEAWGEGINVTERDVAGQTPSIIGRNPIRNPESKQKDDVPVTDWNRPFISNSEGNGHAQAKAQLDRLTKIGTKGYTNPGDVRLREAYDPNTHRFEIRAVDRDGNLLPQNTATNNKKVYGHVITATPVDAREGLGRSNFGTGVSHAVLSRIQKALILGQKYASDPYKYKDARKMVLSIPGVQDIFYHSKGGAPFKTEAAAKAELTRRINKDSKLDRNNFDIIEVEEGWALRTKQQVTKNVYLPTLIWTGAQMLRDGGTIGSDFKIIDNGAGTLQALTEGLQGIDEYLRMQGIESNAYSQFDPSIEKNKGREIIELGPQNDKKAFSLEDLQTASTKEAWDVEDTAVEYTQEQQNILRKNRQEGAEIEVGEPTIRQFFTNLLLPVIRTLVPGRVGMKNGGLGRLGKLLPSSKNAITRQVLELAKNAALNPEISLLFGEPSPDLLPKGVASWRDVPEINKRTLEVYKKWVTKVTKLLNEQVPQIAQREMLADEILAQWHDEIENMKGLEILNFYITKADGDLNALVNEALEEIIPVIEKQIVTRKPKFKNKKLEESGGLIEAVSYNEAKRQGVIRIGPYKIEREPEITNPVPGSLKHEIAQIEAIAAAIRGFYVSVGEHTETSAPVQFQKRIAKASTQSNPDKTQEQLLNVEGGYEPEVNTDTLANAGGQLQRDIYQGQSAEQSTGDQLDDVYYLQKALNAVKDAEDRRAEKSRETLNENPELDRIFDQEVLGEQAQYREENGGATPFNLPEDGVKRFNALKTVFLSGHENFVGGVYIDTLFQLADWASKAFGLTNAESFIDEDGVEHTSRRPIVIVDQTGLDNLKISNPAFADSLEKGLALTDTQAFKVWVPKEHGSNAPYVILVNEDYVYLDNKGKPFTIKHGSTTKSSSVITAFSHELGHIVFEKWKNNMPKALKAKLGQEYQKAVPKTKQSSYPIQEWMADQFAIYGSQLAKDAGETTGAPPAWKKLFANLKKLWDQTELLIRQVLRRAGGPSETYHQYLSKIGRAFASREAARNWYYQQVAKGVAPIDAAKAARTYLEKRYAKDGVIDPALQLKDVVRLRTVPAEDSTAAAVEGAAQAADQADAPAGAADILRQAAARGQSFLDPVQAQRFGEEFIRSVFGDNSTAHRALNTWLKQADKITASVQTRVARLPGGVQIMQSLRERPGDQSTGRGTARVAQRNYYGKWMKKLDPVRRRKGESRADHQSRMTLLRDEIATGSPSSPEAIQVANALREFAQWFQTKQNATRDSSLRKDERANRGTMAPETDGTILRILDSWTMPHNYNIFNLTTPEGKARFYQLMDQYEKNAFFGERAQTNEAEWEAFKEYVFAKITTSEGNLTANMADNLRFANSKSRVLANIPTYEFLGTNGSVPLIDSQIDKALRNYIHDGTRQIAWEEHFGGYEQNPETGAWQWNANRKIKDWIKDLKVRDQQNGTDHAAEAEELMGILQGRSNRKLGKKARVASDIAMALTNMLVLPMAVFASFPDVAGIAMRSDGNLKSLYKNIQSSASAAWGKDINGLNDLAQSLGVIAEHTVQHAFLDEGNAVFDNYWGGKHQKVMEWQEDFFKIIQLQAWTNFTRILAMQVGNDYVNDLYAKVRLGRHHGYIPQNTDPQMRDHNTIHEEAAHAWSRFKELGLEPDEWAAIQHMRSGGESAAADYLADKEAQVLNKFVDESIMRPSAEQKPGWQSDPRWATVAHLKSYFWYMGETYWPRIFAMMGEAMGPQASATQQAAAAKILGSLMLMMPLAALGLVARDSVYYLGTDDEPPERDFLDLVGRTGALGYLTIPLEFTDVTVERGLTANNIARQMGPVYGLAWGGLTQGGRTTASKLIPGVSWFKAGRNAVAGRPNERQPEGTGRYGN